MKASVKKILRYPEKIPCDKRMHILIGVVYGVVGLVVGVPIFYVAAGLPVLAWGIEYFQKWTRSGQYDNMDAVAVLVGGLIAMLPTII